MDLKEDINVWKSLGDADIGCVDDDSDGGLRYPGQGFGEQILNPVEVGPDEAEGIADGTSGFEGMLNGLVPLTDGGM